MTDRVARAVFGYADVFDLADEVFRRAGGGVRRLRRGRRAAARPGARRPRDLARAALPAARRAVPGGGGRHRAAPVAGRARARRRARLGVGGRRDLARVPVPQRRRRADRRAGARLVDGGSASGWPRSPASASTLAVGGGVRRGGPRAGRHGVPDGQHRPGLLPPRAVARGAGRAGRGAGVGVRDCGAVALGWALVAVTAGVTAALAVGARAVLAGRRGPHGLRDRRPARACSAAGSRPLAWVLLYNALAAAFLLHAQVPYLLHRHRRRPGRPRADRVDGRGGVAGPPLHRGGPPAAGPGPLPAGVPAAGLACCSMANVAVCWLVDGRVRGRRAARACCVEYGRLNAGRRGDGRGAGRDGGRLPRGVRPGRARALRLALRLASPCAIAASLGGPSPDRGVDRRCPRPCSTWAGACCCRSSCWWVWRRCWARSRRYR